MIGLRYFALLLLLIPANMPSENVIEYSDRNFTKKITDHDLAIVMFYAPWCGYCKKFEPEFEKAAQALNHNSPPIACVKVNCTEDGRDTCKEHRIFGYPTLKVFRKGSPEAYEGPRSEAAIISFMKKCCRPDGGPDELSSIRR